LTDYQPIGCAQHERLEFSVLRRIPLFIEYQHESRIEREQVLPLDVLTRDGAEWLSFLRQDGTTSVVRLDRILNLVGQGT
jgi:Rho-binding antiterminator